MLTPLEDKERDYRPAIEALTPILHNLPPKLVAIDGRPLVGKTSLGRYLAWRFSISLIEADLFLLGNGRIEHRLHEIVRILDFRLKERKRPVILESITAVRLLALLNRSPDFLIYVECEPAHDTSLNAELEVYEKQFAPRDRANLLLPLSY